MNHLSLAAQLTQLKAERQQLVESDHLQGVILEITEKPRSSPCAPPQYIGRLQRIDKLPFEDGKAVHWVPMNQVQAYQSRIQTGVQIAQLDQQIARIIRLYRK